MSPGDKRHFSLYAKRQGSDSKQYVRLYHMILRQKKYNESKLKNQLDFKSFTQLKHELTKHVMNSLRRNHEKTDHASSLLNVGNAHVLLNRGLWSDASKELLKVFDINKPVDSNSSFLAFSDTSYIESRLGTVESLSDTIQKWDDRKSEMLRLFEIETSYDKLYMQIMVLNRQIESIRSIEYKDQLIAYLNNPLLKVNQCKTSNYAALNFNYCNGLGNYLMGNFERSHGFMQKVKVLIEAHYSIRLKREDLYLRSLGNLCLCALQMGKVDKAEHHLSQLKDYTSFYSAITPYKLYLSDIMELMLLNSKQEYTSALSLVRNKLAASLNNHPQFHLSQEYGYQVFQTITTYLALKYYREAKQIVLNFITENKQSAKRDAYCYARIVYMILLIEENQDDLLENELKSVNRYLKMEKHIFRFERLFLDFTAELLSKEKEAYILYEDLYKEITLLKTIDFESNAFVYFAFDHWVLKKKEANKKT